MTGPVVAFKGTPTVMLVLLQEATAPATTLNSTTLLLWFEPNPDPTSVMIPPILAPGGVRVESTGLITVYDTVAGLVREFTVTVTAPVVAPLGTVATICELAQLVMEVAWVVLNVRVLVP